jgi:hypothetical protein
MAAKEDESEDVGALIDVGNSPRFFVELNEPVTLFGLNPDGLFLPLVGITIFVSLGIYLPILGFLFLGLFLCRRMADNPNILREMAGRFGRRRHVVPNGRDGFEAVKIVSPTRGVLSCGDWLAHHTQDGTQTQPKTRKRRY